MNAARLVIAAALACGCAPTGALVDEAQTDFEGPAFDQAPAQALPAMPTWDDEPPAPGSAGIGTLEVRDSTDLTRQLELAALHVDAKVSGSMVAFEVEHRFDNPTDEVLEGTFRFPLPDRAVVTGLAMEIDGKLMEGEVLDRDRAREIYQSIVDSMQDPALLEWEQGRTFKLRVFPIEAKSDKRVVLRYFAPLRRVLARDGEQWEVVIPTSAPAMQGEIGQLTVKVDGQTVADRTNAAPVGAIRVAVADTPAPTQQQVDEHGTFTAIRVQPQWSTLPEPDRTDAPRRIAIVVDTSRSAMESWGLARESLRVVLESLDANDEICVIASDISARAHAPIFLPASEDEVQAALAFIDGIEPDGASDLSAALHALASLLAEAEEPMRTQVLVVGDGVPTWGETDPDALVALADSALGDTPMHGLVLGRGADGTLLRRIAGQTGGRVERPESSDEIAWFADFLDVAPRLRRIHAVDLQAEGEHDLTGVDGGTLFEGQHATAYVRTAPDATPPESLTLTGLTTQGPVHQELLVDSPVPTAGVRKLWAAEHIETLQRDKSHRAEVIALSETHGVLSRYTAFLVLESEEAYREHAIERRRAAEQAAPNVSGADLGEGDTSLRPGDIQPGDPEILIPAPHDARRVVVVFPFGETKIARWDETAGQWIVRFLIDEQTDPGRYEVAIRVTLKDGSLRRLKAEYTVDTRAPDMNVRLRELDDGSFEVRCEQETSQADRVRERLDGVDGPLPERHSARNRDASKVEVALPDGQTITLTREAPGTFVGTWVPSTPVSFPIHVRVVSTDRALNSAVSEHDVGVGAR